MYLGMGELERIKRHDKGVTTEKRNKVTKNEKGEKEDRNKLSK